MAATNTNNTAAGDTPAATTALAAVEALIDYHPNEAAFERLEEEIAAVPEDELHHINVDIFDAVATVLGSIQRVNALRPEIEATFKVFDFERFDKLQDYALAVNHAHARWRWLDQEKGPDSRRAQAAVLEQVRDQLLSSAQSLATFELLPSKALADFKKVSGYANVASDVLMLVNLFKSNWAQIAGKTPFTLGMLNNAAVDAMGLQAAVGEKRTTPTRMADYAVTRAKAFTLFFDAYRLARRAAFYLRGKKGAEEILPSLHASRGPSRQGRGDSTLVESDVQELKPSAAGEGAAGETGDAGFALDNVAGLPLNNPFAK